MRNKNALPFRSAFFVRAFTYLHEVVDPAVGIAFHFGIGILLKSKYRGINNTQIAFRLNSIYLFLEVFGHILHILFNYSVTGSVNIYLDVVFKSQEGVNFLCTEVGIPHCGSIYPVLPYAGADDEEHSVFACGKRCQHILVKRQMSLSQGSVQIRSIEKALPFLAKVLKIIRLCEVFEYLNSIGVRLYLGHNANDVALLINYEGRPHNTKADLSVELFLLPHAVGFDCLTFGVR